MESRNKSRDTANRKQMSINQRSQLNTRGSNRSQSGVGGGPQGPLVYFPKKKMESEEEKVKRFERVIEKLKKMLE